MSLLLWISLALLALLIGTFIAFRLLARGQVEQPGLLLVDGVMHQLRLRFGSKLPKVLRAGATTAGVDLICFRTYPPGWPIQVVGRPPVSALLAAHECYHIVDRVRRGRWPYWRRILWDIVRHPFDHDARPSEREAIAAAPLIRAGTFPGVDAALLLARFR